MIIAEIRTPKQRMTKIMGVILRYNRKHDNYSVHRSIYGEDQAHCRDVLSQGQGYYDMTLDEAWDKFKEQTENLFSYGTGTFEEIA